MDKTYPVSINELESHNTSQTSHPNGFNHRLGVSEGVYIDIQSNKIDDTSITVDKPVVDLGEFYFVDFSNMVPDLESPTGEYPYVCGQYGLDRGKDLDGSLYYSINMQIYNPNVEDDEETTRLSENCATIDLRIYDDGSKRLVSDAVFVGINCSDPTSENNIANKKYVDDSRKNFITKEEYCADLSKGVLLTNSELAWSLTDNSITLSQPYTDFRFLRVDYTGYDSDYIVSNIIVVDLFHQLMTETHLDRNIGTSSKIRPYTCAVYDLCGTGIDFGWLIWTSNDAVDHHGATKSTTERFSYYKNNAHILGIWGFK